MKYTVLIIITLSSINLLACKCHPRNLEENIQENGLIFSGKVIKIDSQYYTIDITDIWKGNLNDTITIIHRHTTCSIPLELSKEYLLFLEDISSEISICSRSIELKFSQDIDHLNELLKGIISSSENNYTENQINFLNSILIHSKIPIINDLQYDSTFFICHDLLRKKYKILSMKEFFEVDHLARIPLLSELKMEEYNCNLYVIGYWKPDTIEPEKYKIIKRKLKSKLKRL